MKSKNIILVGIFVIGVILWQFGFFTRFNYLTSKIDCWQDSARIVTVGKPLPCGVSCIGLKEDYGFHESNVGCTVSDSQLRGIETYNAQVEEYLKKRNGKNWRIEYQTKLDSLIKTID